MLSRSHVALAGLALTIHLALPARSVAGALGNGTCIVGPQGAATLLVPYFETNYDVPGHTTLFAINNLAPTAHIVRVVLWTDYGIPTLAFDLYLKGWDIQTMSLTDLMMGNLPQSSVGANLSGFPHCSASLRPPGGTPVGASLTRLRNRHIGLPDPGTQICAGADHHDRIARGYITVDVTDQCMPLSVSLGEGTPASWPAGYASYYAPGNPNALTGDVFYIEYNKNQTEGTEVVHIVSDTDRFHNDGKFTFYGRYFTINGLRQGAVDHRAPLSDIYFMRFTQGGAFSGGTSMVVWREVPQTNPIACQNHPSWWPLRQVVVNAVDEDGAFKTIFNNAGTPFPLATQKVNVADLGGASLPSDFGGLYLNLALPQNGSNPGRHAQAFVMQVLSAQSRFSLGFNATRLNDLCGVQ